MNYILNTIFESYRLDRGLGYFMMRKKAYRKYIESLINYIVSVKKLSYIDDKGDIHIDRKAKELTNENIVSFMVYEIKDGNLLIYYIYTPNDQRRRGLATSILNKFKYNKIIIKLYTLKVHQFLEKVCGRFNYEYEPIKNEQKVT